MIRRSQTLMWLTVAVLSSSCIMPTKVRREVQDPGVVAGTSVQSPFKAFLTDGRVAVFPHGARITTDSVFGAGTLYSLDLASFAHVGALALDDLLGLESVQADVDVAKGGLALVAGAVGVVAGTGVIVCTLDPKACFGSCPTIYSYDSSGEVLEAEAFSYSIVPLLEGRDVDRIGVDADPTGVVTLELRNEALETHYVNHLELLEVRHEADRAAYRNEEGRILVVGDMAEAISAIDRDGADPLAELKAWDGKAFSSSDERIRAVTTEDFRDHIELVFPRPNSRSVALVLRFRSSLLNTVLGYDLTLASQGAKALDWLGIEMADSGTVEELGCWFVETTALEISVQGPSGWDRVARLADTGPIAWDEVAIQLPIPDGDDVRVRLSFLADQWRIDFAGLAGEVEFAEPRVAAFARVSPLGGAHDPELAARLALPDEDYLVTVPSMALSLESEPLGAWPDDERTFFLSSQGYYTEWIRPGWIRASNGIEEFEPSGETVVRLMERWLERKGEFEKIFFETRIPVR